MQEQSTQDRQPPGSASDASSGSAHPLDLVRAFAVAAIQRLVAVVADPPEPVALAQAEDQYAAARVDLHRGLGTDVPLGVVAQRACLSPAEIELLAVLVAAEQDEWLQRLIVSVTGDRERHRVELWMLPSLLGADAALAGPDSALRRAALVEVVPRGSFGRTALGVPPRLLWALRADTAVDPAVDPATELLSVGREVVADAPRAVLVVGLDRIRRRQAALQALHASHCLATPAPRDPAGWAALVREATLNGAAVLVETAEAPEAEGRRWIERSTHLSLALSSPTRLVLEDLPRRDWREYAAAEDAPGDEEWAHALGPGVPRLHHLTAEQLDRMRLAIAATGGDPAAAYRRLTSARLDDLARHVSPRAVWEDLVLSPARKSVLMDLVDRYQNGTRVYDEWGFEAKPSRGLVALFAGQSGTGKTLAAEVVARQLGLDLYRLDLSSVVSKYIGETEKNLDALFDAASLGNIVLFFDEADALFGKRSEISDAHDRYANVETSYLLQRLEQYDGIVVLATNYEKNIDRAFLRRVHVRVDFPMPGEAERRAIWERNLGSGAPYADDIDVPWLVERFDISGAAIRNAVVDAAFLAAAEDGPIHMRHLVRGVAREMHKLGRRVTPQVFGAWHDAAVTTTDDSADET